jgi:hypothetical protein
MVSGMKVDLVSAGLKVLESAMEVFDVHSTTLEMAINPICEDEVLLFEPVLHGTDPPAEKPVVDSVSEAWVTAKTPS